MTTGSDHPLIMAFDCGTASLKATLVDHQAQVVAEASEGYGLYHPGPGQAEQSPNEMWAAIVRAAQSVISVGGAEPDAVEAVVFASTWKAIVLLDAEYRPLTEALIWLDSRASEQAAALNEAAGRFVGTGQEYWPRLMWLKEQWPDLWRQAEHVVGLNTYFKYCATGELVTDPSDDFAHSPVPTTDAQFKAIFEAGGLAGDLDKFPKSRPSTARIGSLTTQAAGELGLREGTTVFNGFTDLPAVTIGAGSGALGDTYIYLGSSSWLAQITDSHQPSQATAAFSLDAERRGDLNGLQSACLAYDWVVAQLYSNEKRELGKGINALVNEEVAQTPPGANKLIATHWLNGEIPPLATKNAKALFLNLTLDHDRRHMVRAVMESIAYSHRMALERLAASEAVAVDSLRVVGGGAMSDVWMQIFADVLKVPIEVPASPELAGTVGVACSVLVGLGELKDYSSARDVVASNRRFEPRAEHASTYDVLYDVYQQLPSALQGIFTQLNGDY